MNNIIQNQYMPDYVSPPGETLLEVIESKGMSQAELAIRTGRTKKHINAIIKGKASITQESALQLERVLGIPASFWNNSEQHYQEALARVKERKNIEKDLEWLNKIPVKDMVKVGWIKHFTDKVEQVKEVLNFFGVASQDQWERWCDHPHQANFRKSLIFQSAPGAVVAWLRKGTLDAHNIHCDMYSPNKFRQALQKIRLLTTEAPEVFQFKMIRLCAEAGVAVVFVPELPKVRISGATWWLSPSKAVIQLSLRYKKDDHFWFTFFHEAGHILLHGKGDVFLENEQPPDNEKEKEAEAEADKFAACTLIPETSFKELKRLIGKNGLISKAAIKEIASKIDISPGIVVGRLQHEKILPHTHCNDLKRSFCWKVN